MKSHPKANDFNIYLTTPKKAITMNIKTKELGGNSALTPDKYRFFTINIVELSVPFIRIRQCFVDALVEYTALVVEIKVLAIRQPLR